MSAKATRTYILVLLLALGVVATTVTVDAPTAYAAANAGGAANGDPDRPNDSSKPAAASTLPTGIRPNSSCGTGSSESVVAKPRGEQGWTWAKWYVATLLGRLGH